MSAERVVYSIQRAYIIKPVSKSEKRILTCDERIDIPTIEPLPNVKPVAFDLGIDLTVIPCIELAGEFLSEFNLTFETNEGVTVLPVMIDSRVDPLGNPYTHVRYVLVLPRGTTGIKSCKLFAKGSNIEIQHNFTFGIMPPPYNYDNALFGVITSTVSVLDGRVKNLRLTAKTPTLVPVQLPKGAGKQTINIEDGVLFFEAEFRYSSSTETTTHKPKITLRSDSFDYVYTLSLDRILNNVSIDLFTRTLTVYDKNTHEIFKQLKLPVTLQGYEALSFENFDDIYASALPVFSMGARVE